MLEDEITEEEAGDLSLEEEGLLGAQPPGPLERAARDQVPAVRLATVVGACGFVLPRGAPEPEPEGVRTIRLYRAYRENKDPLLSSSLYEAWTCERPTGPKRRPYCVECGAPEATAEPPRCKRCFRWAWARDPGSIDWPWQPGHRNAWRQAASPYEVRLQATLAQEFSEEAPAPKPSEPSAAPVARQARRVRLDAFCMDGARAD